MTTPHPHSPTILKPAKPVGIVGYGAESSLPRGEGEGEGEIFKQAGLMSAFWYE